MKGLIDKLVEEDAKKKSRIEVLEAENKQMTKDFQTQLKKVQDEFADIQDTSDQELKTMQEKISKLELELNTGTAQATSKNAGAELERKREFESIKDNYEK